MRNAALGLPVSDIDLSTDARPEVVTEAVGGSGAEGCAHGAWITGGTVTVVSGRAGPRSDHLPPRRRDRRAPVLSLQFSDRLEDDAARRRLHDHALYADRRGVVIDTVGGLFGARPRGAASALPWGDAEAGSGKITCASSRFFRFHAHYADNRRRLRRRHARSDCSECRRNRDAFRRKNGSGTAASARGPMTLRRSLRPWQRWGCWTVVLPGANAAAVARLVDLEEGEVPDDLRRLAALGGEEWRQTAPPLPCRDAATRALAQKGGRKRCGACRSRLA